MDGGSKDTYQQSDTTPKWDTRFDSIVNPQLQEAQNSMGSAWPMWATPNYKAGQETLGKIGGGDYYSPATNEYAQAFQEQSKLRDADAINSITGQWTKAYGGNPISSDRYGFALSDYLTKATASDKTQLANMALSNQKNQLTALLAGQDDPYKKAQALMSLAQLGKGGTTVGNTTQTSDLGMAGLMGLLLQGSGSVMGGLGAMGAKI